jgi:hypothetical protein
MWMEFHVMSAASLEALRYYFKLPVITLCSGILLPVYKQCYVVLSTVTKSDEADRALNTDR